MIRLVVYVALKGISTSLGWPDSPKRDRPCNSMTPLTPHVTILEAFAPVVFEVKALILLPQSRGGEERLPLLSIASLQPLGCTVARDPNGFPDKCNERKHFLPFSDFPHFLSGKVSYSHFQWLDKRWKHWYSVYCNEDVGSFPFFSILWRWWEIQLPLQGYCCTHHC